MFGAVLRSDGRTYGDIAKGGLLWGIIVGIIMVIISLFTGFNFLENILSFIGGVIGTMLTLIVGAGIYDLMNLVIDAK